VVGTALVGGVDGPATAADVVPLLVAEVTLVGWGWEGGWVWDWDSGEVQEVRDLAAQEDCKRQRQEEQAQWIARVDSAAGMVQQTCRR
jgi:hypothetical protein